METPLGCTSDGDAQPCRCCDDGPPTTLPLVVVAVVGIGLGAGE